MSLHFCATAAVVKKNCSFFAKMENSEFESPVVVQEQHGVILTCIKKSLQELEKGGDKDDSNPENFVVDLEENVEQEEVQVEKLCNASITQENKKQIGKFIMFYITYV